MFNNFSISIGKNEDVIRVLQIEKVMNHLISLYGKNNIILTGHSLGAYVASKISGDLGLKAVIFNNASSWADTKTDKNSNITHYTTNDIFKGYIDLLSISSAMRDDYDTIKVKNKIFQFTQ